MIDALISQDTHQERVIREITDPHAIKKTLVKNGCVRTEQYEQQETYLKQPEQELLILLEQPEHTKLIRLHQEEDRYAVVSEKHITQEQAQTLKTHYGIALEQTATITHYTYGEVDVYVRTETNKHTIILQADTIGAELYEELGLKAP